MAGGVDAFLAVEREMVAVFADQDVGQQSRRGQAAVLQARGQRGDDGGRFPVRFADILGPDQPAAQQAAGLVVELFADLFADLAPLRGRSLHGGGFQHFLDHREVFGEARSAFLP